MARMMTRYGGWWWIVGLELPGPPTNDLSTVQRHNVVGLVMEIWKALPADVARDCVTIGPLRLVVEGG